MTNWLGGETGLEALEIGRTSLWYTKVVGEVPEAIIVPYVTIGLHEVGAIHVTKYIAKDYSLRVYLNGILVTTQEEGQGRFSIVSDMLGWIMIDYLPIKIGQNNFYIGKKILPTKYNWILCPLKKVHLTNLITAINAAELDLHLEKTLWPVGRLGALSESAEVTTSSVVDKSLFTQIVSAINYLRYVLVNTHQKLVPGSNITFSTNIIDPEFIMNARTQINDIEQVIITL